MRLSFRTASLLPRNLARLTICFELFHELFQLFYYLILQLLIFNFAILLQADDKFRHTGMSCCEGVAFFRGPDERAALAGHCVPLLGDFTFRLVRVCVSFWRCFLFGGVV